MRLVISIAITTSAFTLLPKIVYAQTQIMACSTHGKGCITAQTRQGRNGKEVRLPGGSWIGCKQDCKLTLTDETVDFWQKRDLERGGPGEYQK
jgi:hypothetical protein